MLSVAAFAVFAVLAFSGHFGFIEAKFYQPAVRHPIEQKTKSLAELEQQYTQILTERFLSFAADDSVRSFTMNSASEADVKSRTEIVARLFSASSGLIGIRIIGSDGKRIYYSTFSSDIKKQSGARIVWNDYSDISAGAKEANFSVLDCPPEQKYSIFNDESKSRVIYSIPFDGKDNLGSFSRRAVAVFYYDASDFPRFLLSLNAITLSERTSAAYLSAGASNAGGYVFGLPVATMGFSAEAVDSLKESVRKCAENSLEKNDASIHVENISLSGTYSLVDMETSSREEISAKGDGFSPSLMDRKETDGDSLRSSYSFVVFTKAFADTNEQFFISFVYDSRIFEVSDEIKILLLLLLFITVFLIVFLFFNIKQDNMSVIKDRIRRFELAFITECLDRQKSGGSYDIKKLGAEITERRKELNDEICRSLGRRGKKHRKEIETLLEHSWQEILSALGIENGRETNNSRQENVVKINSRELRDAIEEILRSGLLNNALPAGHASDISSAPEIQQKLDEAAEPEPEPVEEMEDGEVLELAPEEQPEEIEELDDADELDAAGEEVLPEESGVSEPEPMEEVQELDDADELAAADEEVLPEESGGSEPEPLEEVQELDSVSKSVGDKQDDFASAENALLPENTEINPAVQTEPRSLEPPEQKNEFESIEFSYDSEVEDSGEEMKFGSASLPQSDSNEYNKIVDDFEAEPIDFSFLDNENFSAGEDSNDGIPLKTDSFLAKNIDVSGAVDIIPDNDVHAMQEENSHEKAQIPQETADDSLSSPSVPAAELNKSGTEEQMPDGKDSDNDDIKDSLSQEEPAELVEPLDFDGEPFLFSPLASDGIISELQADNSDAIVEEDDGTYHIGGNLSPSGLKLDMDFKKLVDSVLN